MSGIKWTRGLPIIDKKNVKNEMYEKLAFYLNDFLSHTV